MFGTKYGKNISNCTANVLIGISSAYAINSSNNTCIGAYAGAQLGGTESALNVMF